MTINVNNTIKALQDALDRLEVFLSNGEITLEDYYSRVYHIEYELECLNEITGAL
jgi:hypothetical protein